MEVDARTQTNRSVLEADVCIVGAGPAGLTVAAEIARAGMTVLLVESGCWSNDSGLQLLNEATTSGDRYAGLRATRHRQVGGAVNSWNTPFGVTVGAKYAPLDRSDFEPRGDLPGWPIRFADLVPYYQAAQRLCCLGPFRYEGTDWADSAHLLATDGSELTTRVYQFGDRGWCRELSRQLAGDPRVTLCLNATVTRLMATGFPGRVVELEAGTLTGQTRRIRAHQTVLAAGAVENARLLLAAGCCQGSDWLGRCFMEHPRDQSAVLVPRVPGWVERIGFYDAQPRAGVTVAGRLALGDALVGAGGVPNASVTLLPRRRGRSGWRGRLDRWRGGSETLGYGWSRLADPEAQAESLQLVINLEQRPHRENRITLGLDRDALGVPRAHLHWVWSDADQAGLDRVRRVVQPGLEATGLGRVAIDWEARPDPNAHHHSGTTRMGGSPAEGVVDPDGRVFGIDNLFVTGASVFPTAGFANPTLTIVALAIRLGEHLGRSGSIAAG